MKVQVLNQRNKLAFKEMEYFEDALFDVRNHVENEDGLRLYFIHVPGCGRNGKAPEQNGFTMLSTSPNAAPVTTHTSEYGYSDYVVTDHIYIEERQCVVITPGTNMQARSLLRKE